MYSTTLTLVTNTPFTLSWVTHSGLSNSSQLLFTLLLKTAGPSRALIARLYNNNVQNRRAIYNKYLLFGAHQSNAKVRATKSCKATNKMKKAVEWLFLLVGAFCAPIEWISNSVRSTQYTHINFSIATAPLKLFLYVILLPYFYQFEGSEFHRYAPNKNKLIIIIW